MAVNAPWEQWLRIRRRPKYPHEKLRALLDDLLRTNGFGRWIGVPPESDKTRSEAR